MTVDEPWGTSLLPVLMRDQPDIGTMLVDEGLDPTGCHAGSTRYAHAWERVDQVEREELAFVTADAARQRSERVYLWSEDPDAPLEPAEEPDLLPLPRP